jgi:hypothetical protein
MSTIRVSEELRNRLAVEAARQGKTVDDLATETLEERFPARQGMVGTGADSLDAFIGSGDSGDSAWASRPAAELRAEAYKRQVG